MSDRSRRDFLHVAGAGFVLAASGCHSGSSGSKPLASVVVGTGAPAGPVDSAPKVGDFTLPAGGVIPRRKLGRTGLEVSMLGIGGYHIGTQPEEADSIRIVREAIDHGVTFLDNCWDYNKGVSEERMGKALRDGYRQRVVLMTKLDGRTAAAVTGQLEQSLRRLGTDVLDVVQIHEVIRDTDPDRVFGPGGAIRRRASRGSSRRSAGRSRRPSSKASSASSDSPATRAPRSIARCSPRRRRTASGSTPSRCRST